MSQTEKEAATAVATPPQGTDGNGTRPQGTDEHAPPEVRAALSLARRYRLPYVDLLPPTGESPIDYALLGEVPVELMLRHLFVPLRREGRRRGLVDGRCGPSIRRLRAACVERIRPP